MNTPATPNLDAMKADVIALQTELYGTMAKAEDAKRAFDLAVLRLPERQVHRDAVEVCRVAYDKYIKAKDGYEAALGTKLPPGPVK